MSTNLGGLGASAGGAALGGSVFDAVGGAKRGRDTPKKSVSFGESAAAGAGGSEDTATQQPAGSAKRRRRRKHISLGAPEPVVEVEYEAEEDRALAK